MDNSHCGNQFTSVKGQVDVTSYSNSEEKVNLEKVNQPAMQWWCREKEIPSSEEVAIP